MNTSLPPPLRSKLGGKREWKLKPRQDLTPAVIRSQEPNKMRIALISVTEAGLVREVYYDRGYGNGEPFDWNDSSDIFLLNDWRREKIRKYTPGDLGQMERTNVVRNQVIENRVVKKPVAPRAMIEQSQKPQTGRKQTSAMIREPVNPNKNLDTEFITMVGRSREMEKFRARKRRSARQVTPRLANGRRQHRSNPQGPIEFLPVDLERLSSLTPKQQRRAQNTHVKNWLVIFEMIESSLGLPNREIGVEYNL
ncbi:uncharacterized protein EAF01_001541 [Botrytis porri]|uniref:Uncharacterized protein n=1 Tax=Botrytis porri TaxID=87229 RepID=A0A4Z1KNQ1_9HELO|nr:uncharacterized protein EAF01_001541 [Botrytis porri]KAF7912520.1 hypothetical protein EAF01_001541 [Botrytis porri]TGO87006.1 hypothetical protein BPOR_0259g00020 [Botrytis porri]